MPATFDSGRRDAARMNLNDCTIYVFVRGDLKEEDQMVQAAHAIFGMTQSVDYVKGEGCPRIVFLDGGSSDKAINKTLRNLSARLPAVDFVDPDKQELGITAIATVPLTKEQALPLANYRLRRYTPPTEASAVEDLSVQRGATLA